MIEYFLKGGIIMYPILLCSVVSITIIIERLIFFSTVKINPALVEKTLELISKKEMDKAKKIVEKLPVILKDIFIRGIDEFFSINFEEILRDTAEQQIPKLERFLPLLAAIASVSTLLGFTGTVFGMIKAFESIATAGYASPQVVAKGIAEALITTAAGLIVAIPTIAFYHYFNYRVNRYISRLEHYVQELINVHK
ncbi:MAG: MotA/TolQ/ExbB proton channel family protein [Endomicrobia bacterium]|nr:MotA/TolQ/ExbB proton channel family protein [Endomicrobiia bacterium]MCX7940879.1 MotA/TolQ/ExbB proton channel family protein [Endomicrobiia bacterium]MDW8055562.1 MotA/TolQ/ExbB proton channel family protein [Elusimicrobiota bacterium]